MKVNQNEKVKIAFAGSGPFAEPVLESLARDFKNLTLIVKKSTPRDSSVCRIAQKRGLKTLDVSNKDELHQITQSLNPDIAVVVSFGIIISKETLEIPRHGFLNVHFSLLPIHRGPSPVQFTILNGDKKAGITIQKISPEIDAGDIIYQESVGLKGKETTKSLGETLASLASDKITEVINDYINGDTILQGQDHKKTIYSRVIKKSDGKVDWGKSAEEIERMVRAYIPWPGAYTFWNGKMLKILKADVLDEDSEQKIGTFIEMASQNSCISHTPGEENTTHTRRVEPAEYGIQTGKGILTIKKLQLEGKKAVTVSEFTRGYRDIVGKVLGN